MPLLGFEPTISAGERPQTYALDRAATGTGSHPQLLSVKAAFDTLEKIQNITGFRGGRPDFVIEAYVTILKIHFLFCLVEYCFFITSLNYCYRSAVLIVLFMHITLTLNLLAPTTVGARINP